MFCPDKCYCRTQICHSSLAKIVSPQHPCSKGWRGLGLQHTGCSGVESQSTGLSRPGLRKSAAMKTDSYYDGRAISTLPRSIRTCSWLCFCVRFSLDLFLTDTSGIQRNTHSVPPCRIHVSGAWRHLQVVRPVGGCGSWDPRCPVIGKSVKRPSPRARLGVAVHQTCLVHRAAGIRRYVVSSIPLVGLLWESKNIAVVQHNVIFWVNWPIIFYWSHL